MANRITAGIAKAKETIEAQIAQGLTTQDAVDKLGEELDMSMELYVDFQNRKSLASMDGRLTPEEAQSIYMLIGETPSKFNSLSVYEKIVLTQVHMSLLKK